MFDGLFIDGFAGGGGASTGIAQAIGRAVDIAINHSPTAIAIHKANHPATEHHCQDIRAAWPRAVTRNRRVAGVWMSPDCKEFSKAKGGPVKDRSIRTLADEIPHWLEETQPDVAYVENVEEFEDWGPLEQGEDGKWRVIMDRKSEDFKKWVRLCRRAGYRVAWRQLRACDYGAPTSRNRLYIVMRRDKKPIQWPKPTHGKPGSPGVRSGRLLPYRTAAECIDWSIPCPSIFGRSRELADSTKRRIAHGIMRYVVNAAKPFIVPVTHQGSVRVHDIDEPMRTVTGVQRGELAAVEPVLAPHITKFHTGSVGSAMDKEMPTVTSNGQPARPAGAMPLGMAGAVLVPHVMTNRNSQKPFTAADEPTHTITAGGAHQNMVGATLVGVGGRRGQSPPMGVDGTYPTTTAKADAAVATAQLAPFVTHGQHGGRNRAVDQPHHTVAASKKDTNGIAIAAMAPLQNGERRPGEKPREQDINAPLSTIATGGKHAHITAFLSSFYGSDKTNSSGDPEAPLRTARASGQHHAVVAAHIEQANGGPRNTRSAGRAADRPLSTATATGSQQRIVQTTMIEEGALPPQMLERAVEVAAFLVKYYATDGENEVAQSQVVDRPLDTITTKARFAVVTVTIDAVTYVIVDVGLRMLKPRELARAQGFPDNYVLDPIVRKFLRGKWVERPLTIAEQISAIGNSVCPPVARALVEANQPGLPEMRMAA